MILAMIAAAALGDAQPSAPAPAAVPPPVASAAPHVPSSGRDIGFFTAGQLADRCGSSDSASLSYCFAYITAVHDTMKAYEIWLNQREFCVPAGDAQGDLRRAFLTYLSAYPSNRSGQAASVIVVALKQTYPCIEAAPAAPASAPPAGKKK